VRARTIRARGTRPCGLNPRLTAVPALAPAGGDWASRAEINQPNAIVDDAKMPIVRREAWPAGLRLMPRPELDAASGGAPAPTTRVRPE
jgi:hypothetical protein